MLVLKEDEGDRAFSQASAKMLDLATYNTGKPCIWAHHADRYTANRSCVECVRLFGKGKQDLKKQREDHSLSNAVTKEQAKEWKIAFYNTMRILPCGHISQQLVINDKCRRCLNISRNEKAYQKVLKSKEVLDLLS